MIFRLANNLNKKLVDTFWLNERDFNYVNLIKTIEYDLGANSMSIGNFSDFEEKFKLYFKEIINMDSGRFVYNNISVTYILCHDDLVIAPKYIVCIELFGTK